MPIIRVGRLIRVPTAALRRILEADPTRIDDEYPDDPTAAEPGKPALRLVARPDGPTTAAGPHRASTRRGSPMSQRGSIQRRGVTWRAVWRVDTPDGRKQYTKSGFPTRIASTVSTRNAASRSVAPGFTTTGHGVRRIWFVPSDQTFLS